MSNAVEAQHPAVVLRTAYQHLRALLAIATIVVVGLTIAVVVLAINNGRTSATPTTSASSHAIHASPSAETGATLDHSGRNATGTQTAGRLANYPDAPPPSASTPQPSVSYYLDAPQP